MANAEWSNLRNLRNLRINSGWILFSGPVQPAGLFSGGQLKGTGGGFFAASGAADIEVFQVCGQENFRLQEALLESKSAGADEFGFKHGSCAPANKWVLYGTEGMPFKEDTTISLRSSLLFCPLRPSLAPSANQRVFPVSGDTQRMLNR
jgi:hypothetical protein